MLFHFVSEAQQTRSQRNSGQAAANSVCLSPFSARPSARPPLKVLRRELFHMDSTLAGSSLNSRLITVFVLSRSVRFCKQHSSRINSPHEARWKRYSQDVLNRSVMLPWKCRGLLPSCLEICLREQVPTWHSSERSQAKSPKRGAHPNAHCIAARNPVTGGDTSIIVWRSHHLTDCDPSEHPKRLIAQNCLTVTRILTQKLKNDSSLTKRVSPQSCQ